MSNRTYSKQEVQKLIDIIFEIGLTISDKRYREYFDKLEYEELPEWIAKQLKGCGFNTHPLGSSWGYLND